jgi:hypothetical protein
VGGACGGDESYVIKLDARSKPLLPGSVWGGVDDRGPRYLDDEPKVHVVIELDLEAAEELLRRLGAEVPPWS